MRDSDYVMHVRLNLTRSLLTCQMFVGPVNQGRAAGLLVFYYRCIDIHLHGRAPKKPNTEMGKKAAG